MANLIQFVAFCVIWMLVECASVTPSEVSIKKPVFEFGKQCDHLIDMKDSSLMKIQVAIMKEIESNKSLESLDALINDGCIKKIDKDELYRLVIRGIENCTGEKQNFTNAEGNLIKDKLERIACPLFVRLVAFGRILPHELDFNATIIQEFTKCEEKYGLLNFTESFRTWFVGSPEICSQGTGAIKCISNVTEGLVSDSMTKNIQSVSDELLGIMGCSTSVPNLGNPEKSQEAVNVDLKSVEHSKLLTES